MHIPVQGTGNPHDEAVARKCLQRLRNVPLQHIYVWLSLAS